MERGVRRKSLYIAATLILLSLSYLLLLLGQDATPSYPSRLARAERQNRLRESVCKNADLSNSSPCRRNESVVHIPDFSSLPGHIQDFLSYRHCRHFPLLLDVPDKCGGADNSDDVFLLLAIKSSPWNYDHRQILRKTWAKERAYRGLKIRRVFLCGHVGTGWERENLHKVLEFENREYNDILQWDFHDSFFNLTLKQVLFMGWLEKNCPHVRFLFNGDDDVFANTDNMVDYLRGLDHANESSHVFVGKLIENPRPIRVPESKYYIPVQVHDSEFYPDYCGGGGFLMSGYTAMVIHVMSLTIPLYPIDDVYIGMCLRRAKLKPKNHLGIHTFGFNHPSNIVNATDPCLFRDVLLVHKLSPHDLYIMWYAMQFPKRKCSRFATFVNNK